MLDLFWMTFHEGNNVGLDHRILTIFDHFTSPHGDCMWFNLIQMALRAIWKKSAGGKCPFFQKALEMELTECRAVLGDVEERFAGWAL